MFDEYKEQIKNIVFNRNFLLILVLIIIFIGLSIYIYKEHVSPNINANYIANKEFVTKGENNNNGDDTENVADLYLFYTTWCPHCKTTKPIWQKLKDNVGDNGVKGVKINFIEIDCDKEKELATKFNVEGYPTIKMVYNDQIIEYDAKPNLETLNQFLETYI